MKNPDVTSILPFSTDQKKIVEDLLHTFDNQQLTWLAGYLSGISLPQSIKTSPEYASQTNENSAGSSIAVLYGSRTGNGASVAKKIKIQAELNGISVRLEDLNDYPITKLKDEKYVLVIVSTHGEGVPPIAAEEFYDFIHGKRAPKLTQTKYSVLALGDRSYVHFCKTGKDVDKRLEELGAERIYPRIDCDIDFLPEAENWINGIVSKLQSQNGSSSGSSNGKSISPGVTFPKSSTLKETTYTKANPFKTRILDKIKLNGRGSGKETFHYEISLENSGIVYEPGDALGIYPVNSAHLVNELLETLKLDAKTKIEIGGSEKTLEQALAENLELSTITSDVISKYNTFAKSETLSQILEDPAKQKDFIYGRDIIDLVSEFPAVVNAKDLSGLLRNLQPRLYSIASSIKTCPEEVHLTISTVRYKNGREKEGTCSSFLSNRITDDQKIAVYVERNPEFRLPSNPDTRVIMVGPGTGIAPFRAFLQEREANGDKGKNWLFFGDRHFSTDFLYQTEFQNYHKKGLLTRFNVAFSRDTDKKVYVQNKMLEHSRELFSWLEEGACFYVCGDMKNMWNDVNKTLMDIIVKEGGLSLEKAGEYIKTMKKSRRYQADVY